MSFDWQELIGYLASALVVTSLAMTSVVRLRLLSLAGSATFTTYGFLIGSAPIVITNAAITCLNVWFLSREFGSGRDLGAVVVPPDSPFLVDFLANHAHEIAMFQPEHDPAESPDFALVLTRNGMPAGAVLGHRADDRLDITLDYVLRAYRDSRLGNWLYGPGARVFRDAGITTLTTSGGNETHVAYLARVGFDIDADTARFTRRV
jgi:hypothetical protein